MDKLSFLKTKKQNLRDLCRLSRHYKQAEYNDKFLQEGNKVPFKHTWALLGHMHDLRVWTIAYAPSRYNNLKRLQEIHRLNNEMWYMVSNALWKRILVMIGLWIFVTRIAKDRFMVHGQKDSHDAQMRDTTGHM